jgi:hypothetical protein
MSGEQVANQQPIDTLDNKNLDELNTNSFSIKMNKKKISKRVDINVLMSKIRNEKKKQSKENLVFFGLLSSVIIVTGIIASL